VVTLDIDSIRSSDIGIYTCKAINLNGEATSTTSIKVKGRECCHIQGFIFNYSYIKTIRKGKMLKGVLATNNIFDLIIYDLSGILQDTHKGVRRV